MVEAAVAALQVHPREWSIIQEVLQTYFPSIKIWAFGSRAKGRAKPYSDLDLVLMTETPVAFKQLAAAKRAFEESRLPFKVDLTEWTSLSEAFREMIKAQHIEVQ